MRDVRSECLRSRLNIELNDDRILGTHNLMASTSSAAATTARRIQPLNPQSTEKMMTLVASALAGGDCIDDADTLRAGGTARVLGCVVKAPSTPRFREGRLWGRSCAASVGATSVNWTG